MEVKGQDEMLKGGCEDGREGEMSASLGWWCLGLQGAGFLAFIVWIIAAVLEWGAADYLLPVFLVVLILTQGVARYLWFRAGATSGLGFATEMVFILGVAFVLVSFVPSASFLMGGAVLCWFVLSPLLGILNRGLRIRRGDVGSVVGTVIEIVIFIVPVVFGIWFFVVYVLGG